MNCCAECGATTNLCPVDGEYYCRKHWKKLPKQRCSAAKKHYSLRGTRCGNSAYLGNVLCTQHKQVGAEPKEWEACRVCGRDKQVDTDICVWCERRGVPDRV